MDRGYWDHSSRILRTTRCFGQQCPLRAPGTVGPGCGERLRTFAALSWGPEGGGCRLYARMVRLIILYGALIWTADLKAKGRCLPLVRCSRGFPRSNCRL